MRNGSLPLHGLILLSFGLSGACVSPPPGSNEGAETDGATASTTGSSGDPSGSSSDATSSTGDAETEGETDDPGGSTGTTGGGNAGCTPPPLLQLDDIPDDPSLNPQEDDVVATFEVDGHDLIGKWVSDPEAAEGGLKLWQEFTLRIPENQLLDLVQLDISLDTDPVAYFNRRGNVTTSRLGLKIGFSVENFELNQDDPCAPLEPRRGTFDWSLVHEFGHLRGFVDGSWPAFLATFPDVQGDGEGYPADGSPVLTGDFVTSYAERADGDEDHAETWTTYVMLPAEMIPPEMPGEDLVLQKLHWMDRQPDLRAVRDAIRITESDATGTTVPAAPRLPPDWLNTGGGGDPVEPEEIEVPPTLFGEWREGDDGYRVTFSADDIVIAQYAGGMEIERLSLAEQKAADGLEYFEIHENTNPDLAYSYILVGELVRHNHDFFLQGDGQTVLFARERLDEETGDLEYLPDLFLTRTP